MKKQNLTSGRFGFLNVKPPLADEEIKVSPTKWSVQNAYFGDNFAFLSDEESYILSDRKEL